MQVLSIARTEEGREHLLLLREAEGERVLPMVIGLCEAMSIATAVQGHTLSRPFSHDLLDTVIRRLGGELIQVAIHDVRDEAFIAQLEVRTPNGVVEIDCRPSDGVALALRAGVPIVASEDVMEASAVTPSSDGDEDDERPLE